MLGPSRLSLTAAVIVAIAAAVCACSSSSGDACSDEPPPASFDPMNPKVSFSNDVLPIFNEACAFSVCHGSTTGAQNGVYLGRDDATAVHDGLVGEPSTELPAMNLVSPGDPRNSYLMRKVDGSQCALDAQCQDGTCGSSMPKDSDRLPAESRDVIRRWIAQGAKND